LYGYELGLYGDDVYGAVALPFEFFYYDQYFSTIYVSSNGWLSFADTDPWEYWNYPLPTGEFPYLIAPFWIDLQAEFNIHVWDGSVGVLIRKNDGTEVYGNKISGKAYYGFHFWGSEDREGFDLGSNVNLIEDNDLSDLEIRSPDEYSDSNVDGRMFTGSPGKSATAHVWLNPYSNKNRIKIIPDETVIDEGEDNEISYQDTR